MRCEKREDLERWTVHPRIHLHSLLISVEFLIYTAGFMDLAYMYGLVLPLFE
jgi:hypothetical protein